VIKKPGADATEEELHQYVLDGLSKHKAPRYVKFIDAFPLTASGKIQKYKLREWGAQALGLSEDNGDAP